MKRLFNKKNRALLYIFLLIHIVVVSGIILVPHGQIGTIMLGLLMLVSFVSLFFGLISGLGLTLILLFVVGSMIFWFELTNQPFLQVQLPVMILFAWMVLMIAIALLAGFSVQHMNDLYKQNHQLKEEIRSLVATDPLTGFDNKERMFMELEVEHSRAKRYDQTFAFLLLQVQHYEQFFKLYGETELNNMIRNIALKMVTVTRPSDLRFRMDKDKFAILFTNTSTDTMDVIIEKLNKELRVFQLENQRIVTMTFSYGYAGYEDAVDNYLDVYEEALNQVSSHVA